MTLPCIIGVAITGSVPQKSDNPALPVTVSGQLESTQEAFEAGASIAHAHVRDEGRPTSDPERFAQLKEGLRSRDERGRDEHGPSDARSALHRSLDDRTTIVAGRFGP